MRYVGFVDRASRSLMTRLHVWRRSPKGDVHGYASLKISAKVAPIMRLGPLDGIEPDKLLFGHLRRRFGAALGVTARFTLYFWILDTPVLSELYMCARGPLRASRIRTETCLVIDGYPRSANTYSRLAFLAGNPRAGHIATHVHSPRIIRTAVRREIPCIVLIRSPADAVSSMVQFTPGLSLKAALQYYCTYYRRVLTVRTGVIFADFDQVTSDFNSILRRCNIRFGTAFHQVDYDDQINRRLLGQIEQSTRRLFKGPVNEHVVSRPSPHRKPSHVILANLGVIEQRLLINAEILYATVRAAVQSLPETRISS